MSGLLFFVIFIFHYVFLTFIYLSPFFGCHLSIDLSIHIIDQFTLSVTLEHDWPLLMTSFLADLRTFIGWVCRFSEVGRPSDVSEGINVCFFCSRYIFTTYRKSNQDIVLLQPSIIDDSIQARRLWAGLLGSVIHSVRRSEESSGDKEEEKQEVGRRFRKKQKGKNRWEKNVWRGEERELGK